MKKFLYWLPRILGILFIAFLTMFSLDVFGEGVSFWQGLLGFVIHSIPSILLIIILIIAWRRPKIGGIAFLVFAALFVALYLLVVHGFTLVATVTNLLILSGPILLVGILFVKEQK